MPSSITSSDERLPRLAWRRIAIPALAAFIAFVVALEVLLYFRGVDPTVTDSEARWQKERNRADDLGSRALILVGASRMQIDVDLDEARRLTQLEPVQLAVSGANWMPIFAGLADDPEVRGTVLVDFDAQFIASPASEPLIVNDALIYQQHFRRLHDGSSPSNKAEEWLADRVHLLLRSYADDATPWQSLLYRIFVNGRVSQYITTKPDRSRAADFSRLPSSWALLPRSLVNLGRHIPLSYKLATDARREELDRAIAALQPEDNRPFLDQTRILRSMVEAIRRRGGHVYFIRMPSSGWVLDSQRKRFPRSSFWDPFVAEIGAPSLNFSDSARLRAFFCPDGYHIDYHDRSKFTAAMLRELNLESR